MLVDAHVHLFPDRLADAIRAWFDTHAWDIVHRVPVERALATLREGGVDRVVALPYVHKPGMAKALNDFTRELSLRHPEVLPCCTVFPGEEGDEALLEEALSQWARGMKMHCHVMKVAPDDPRMEAVWRASARHRKPVVIHCGPEPQCEGGYGIDTRTVSGADRLRRALDRHPDAIAVVPHLGYDDYEGFEALVAERENVYMDTTMALAGFFPKAPDPGLLRRHPRKILYGTDFPNLPYEWDRELRNLRALRLPHEDDLLGGNALRLFGQ